MSRNQIDRTVVFPTMSPNEPNLALRGAPGTLPPWVRTVIAAAAGVTIAMVGLGGQLLYNQLDNAHSTGQWWLHTGVSVAIALWIAASFLPASRHSRFLRLAVLLPVAHAGAIALGWMLWSRVATHVTLDARSPLAAQLPLARLALVTCLVFVLVARLSAKRRTGEWVHGFVVLALTELLLLGLWMPIVAVMWGDDGTSAWFATSQFVEQLGWAIAYIVVPPTLAAIAYTMVVLRNPRWLTARKRIAINTVAALLGLACLARLTADADTMLVYAHFVPVLLVAALVALVALAVLAAVLAARAIVARRRFDARERVRGVVTADGHELVAGIEIASWLRGPRVVQRPFAVATAHGTLPVSGANVVAAIPAASTQLLTGEALGLLRPGDTVEVAGHDATPAQPGSGDPFRSLAGPRAEALWIRPSGEGGDVASLSLALWRPCLAYLLIVTAIAIPGLAALLAC